MGDHLRLPGSFLTSTPFSMLTRKQMVQQMAIYDQLIVNIPILCPKQPGNLPRQEAGWKPFHLLHRAPDMDFQQLRRPPSIISAVRRRPNIGMATVKVV